MQVISKEPKERGAERATLLDAGLRGHSRANPAVDVPREFTIFVKAFDGCLHLTTHSKALQNLPQHGALHPITSTLEGQKACKERLSGTLVLSIQCCNVKELMHC